MRKKIALVLLSLILVFTTYSPIGFEAFATSIDTLKDKQKEIKDKQNNLNNEKKTTQQGINQIQGEQKTVESEVKRLDFEVTDTKQKIRDKNAEIETAQVEIARLEEEITVLLSKIETRNDLLEKRMRALQESGGSINYLDVILGASSFSDLVTRVTAVTTFLEADKELIRLHKQDKDNLVVAQENQKSQLEQLSQAKKDLEVMVAKLAEKIAQKNVVLAQLEQKEEEMHEILLELEDEAGLLKAQEAAIKKEIAAWEAAQKAGQNQNISGKIFINPTTGRKTSDYGQRWGRLHSGIDVGKNGRTGDVPIIASAGGTVIRADYDRSYGNVVFMTHYINGKVYTTVYAHLEKTFVSSGQQIKQGQVLGYMGNTGNSTGAHLHFEIHEGSWNGSRSNSVNPLKYVSY